MAASEAELATRIAIDVAALSGRTDEVAAECRSWMTPTGSDRPLRFTSQFGQDSTLLTLFAGGVASNRQRVYVDVGANDPKALSNTYFFDKCLGWRGVCIEANPGLAAALRKERSCVVVNKCVAATHGTLRFVPNGVNGHIAVGSSEASVAGAVDVECGPLADILRDVGIDRVDYMSVDIEGAEIPALAGYPWDNLPVEVLQIETNWASRELDFLISDAGFWKVSDLGFNDELYVRGPKLLKASGWEKARRDSWEWQQAHERDQKICIKRDGML